MGRYTYYIVELAPGCFVRHGGPAFAPASACDAEQATRFTMAEARSVYRNACRGEGRCDARRFPRIIKVSTETKTVKDRR